MNLQQLVTSKGFKKNMAKLYGWGASVVIIGALFKIQHWPFAGIMLTIGLGTEALIFFFSAFEPPHAEPDWSLVYPELAGMYDMTSEDKHHSPTEELDNMLEKAKIGPELIESLGIGLRNLSTNAAKMADVSSAHVATNEYVDNIKNASGSVAELTNTYKKTSESLGNEINVSKEYFSSLKNASTAAGELAKSYSSASETIKTDQAANAEYISSIRLAANSAKELAQQYKESAETLVKTSKGISSINIDGAGYQEKLQEIAKNLGALNAVYELQLQSSNDQVQSSKKLQEGMKLFIDNLNESVDNTMKYKEQSAMLTKNIAALNNIYGNMLSAMNVKL